MKTLPRRQFLIACSLLPSAARLAPPALAAPSGPGARPTLDLTPGAIGVSGDPFEILRLAHAHGFESVQPDSGFLSRQDAAGIARVLEALRNAGLKWGAAGLPVDFRRDDASFQRDLDRLPRIAAALREAGVTRIGTWLSPGSNDRNYEENLALHADRLGKVARILSDHGLNLGLEYVGTPSLRARSRYPFVYKLSQARELIAAIHVPGTGVILDSWHWWTAGETAEDIAQLRNSDIIAVDLNDAPAGIPLEQQQDNRRELPAATGVIPVQSFLRSLLTLGYDGPIRAEPFNDALNQLDNDAACAKTIAALRKAMDLLKA
jgi:sugar phosphate isomerase/epimerase